MITSIFDWFCGRRAVVVEPQSSAAAVDPLRAAIERGECPDCHGREFYFGAEGGCSQNIKCANEQCGSRFNVGFFPGGRIVERIGART